MPCDQCRGIDQVFDDGDVAKDLKNYRKKGPAKTTLMLVDAIEKAGVEGKSVLDIGGGVGAIPHRLLDAGAVNAVGVDASKAYVQVAHEEARRLGLSDRIRTDYGNFVEMAPEVELADVVTLDKVICCFDDVEMLIRLSAERAGELYGLVYPRDNWISRTFFKATNLFFWLKRSQFRVFVRPAETVDALVRKSGLSPLVSERTLVWHVVLYKRQESGANFREGIATA